MTNLSEINAFRDRFVRLDVDRLLDKRDLRQQFSSREASYVSYSSPRIEEATAMPRPQKIEESLYVLTPRPQKPPVILNFVKEQHYEGTVVALNLDDETFTARLKNLTSPGPDEEGEFSLDEINDDTHLVTPGALFTWTIGLQLRGTTKQRVSDIRFRRLPSLDRETIAKAEAEAEQLANILSAQDAAEAFTSKPRSA